MARKNFDIPGHAHFLTFTCYRRKQLLTADYARQLLAESIDAAREQHQLSLWAYVFMPEHVHLLIHPSNPEYSIAQILHELKGRFAREFGRELKVRNPARYKSLLVRVADREYHRIWQAGGGFDRNLYTPILLRRAVEYIEWNPVRRGLVAAPLDWEWSSARARAADRSAPLAIDPPGWRE